MNDIDTPGFSEKLSSYRDFSRCALDRWAARLHGKLGPVTPEYLAKSGVWPSITIFTPTPLVVPIEVADAFFDAALGPHRPEIPKNNLKPLPIQVCQQLYGRRAELEGLLQKLIDLHRASKVPPLP